MAPKTD
jgi:hypothetical protein